MIKINAYFNIFNEAQFIKEAIEAVVHWVDKVIVVDGAWQGFPTTSTYSDDGTVEIINELIETHPNIAYFKMSKQTLGYEKNHVMLNEVEQGDYIIRLNGDEILEVEKDVECPRKELLHYIEKTNYLPLYTIPIYLYRKPSSTYFIPRIVKKTPTLNLTGRHLVLTNPFIPEYKMNMLARGMVMPIQANIGFIALRHMSAQRTENRKADNDIWLRNYYDRQYKMGII